MIKFWCQRRILNYLLLPLSFVWWLITWLRLQRKGRASTALVVCLGNITVGGSGKTPMVLYLYKQLSQRGYKVAVLSRGYGGKLKKGPCLLTDTNRYPHLVGDEAVLISQTAPVVVGSNRSKGIELLEAMETEIILMDDGLQNPTVKKDISILLFNTMNPMGNSLIIPAGPLRETLNSAAQRVDLVVGVGSHNPGLAHRIDSLHLPYLTATIEANASLYDVSKRYLAFAALAEPHKFFTTLECHGFQVLQKVTFPDHYLYTEQDIQTLIAKAQKQHLRLITTSKDYVKIAPQYHDFIDNFKIELFLDPASKKTLLDLILSKLKHKLPTE